MHRVERVGSAAIAGVLVLWAVVLGVPPLTTATQLARFDHMGEFKWTAPVGIRKVTFDVFGAAGGNYVFNKTIVTTGGRGGEAKGTFKVKPGWVFDIWVGQRGSDPAPTTENYYALNGGGVGGLNGGGGGGASDVRLPGKGNKCPANRICGLSDRIIVGGGGGGAGAAYPGGQGGGANGGNGAPLGSTGGGQESIYADDTCHVDSGRSCLGYGGWGQGVNTDSATAGGGGGLYGGNASLQADRGGGGGSGYVSPLALSGSFPGGTRLGDGLVVITMA